MIEVRHLSLSLILSAATQRSLMYPSVCLNDLLHHSPTGIYSHYRNSGIVIIIMEFIKYARVGIRFIFVRRLRRLRLCFFFKPTRSIRLFNYVPTQMICVCQKTLVALKHVSLSLIPIDQNDKHSLWLSFVFYWCEQHPIWQCIIANQNWVFFFTWFRFRLPEYWSYILYFHLTFWL